ncbi:cytochrome c biogenesis CcdA family protein [Ornithinimicrobium sediminis]|uniref:cytochrome c biogenesis CcdA family protein n=1 Tax=Ornithinimicrobium sediminis TaxID=2904603 RepID=UPI001E550570|nr:cytochrome c biogenesis protein CcdA [Ornithinimicrobium sediminis]MCE0486917.1 cytochrome C biogenesis protein [Ornithinimicrobium sediminis]
MLTVLGALVAGVLTTLAPCVLPLLPVIVGGSVAPEADRATQTRRAMVIAASLGLSVALFTLALKGTTALIGVPPQAWQWLSGGILVALGLAGVFPGLWDRVAVALRLSSRTHAGLRGARSHDGVSGQVLTGAALGPVFSSCSPLYAYVVVTVLPADLGFGLVLLAAYCLGLSATLLVIALAGQRAVGRLGWAAQADGWFRRSLGVVFLAVGLVVLLGWDREVQAWVLEHSPVAPWELDSGFIPQG